MDGNEESEEGGEMSIRIQFISDLHNKLDKVKLVPSDWLLIAGDLSINGRIPEISKFNHDLQNAIRQFKFKHIIYTAGNHDDLFKENQFLAKSMVANAVYLEDKMVEIEGVKIWGSPYSPTYGDFVFNYDRGEPAKQQWSKIPNDIDILMTHAVPYNMLDMTNTFQHVGCENLLDAILQRDSIRIHVGGHLHFSHGVKEFHDKLYINAAICNDELQPIHTPVVIDFDPTTKAYTIVQS